MTKEEVVTSLSGHCSGLLKRTLSELSFQRWLFPGDGTEERDK